MSDQIKINYALTGALDKILSITAPKEATLGEVLNMINTRHQKNYTAILYEQSEIDLDDLVFDFLESDPECVFIITSSFINDEPPTQENPENLDSDETFRFLFTGSDKEMLLKGIDVKLSMKMTPSECENSLLRIVRDKIGTNDKYLMVYLAGGLRFVSGTLGDFYLNKEKTIKKRIYGVVSSYQFPKLDGFCVELYVVSDFKKIVLPLCDSTERGITDIACLLGFLMRNETVSNVFWKACSSVTFFAPFIVSLKKIVSSESIREYDVVNVCSTLYTLFRSLLPLSVSDEKVLEYGLRLCNLIGGIEDLPEKYPIVNFDKSAAKSFIKETCYLCDSNYLWMADLDEDFTMINFNQPSEKEIESAYELYSAFTPVSPLAVRNSNTCCIVKGKDHEYLYMMKTPMKIFRKNEMIDILDPLTKFIESKDYEEFAKMQKDEETDDVSAYIDTDKVKQIIMIDFDSSQSMINDLNGHRVDADGINRVLLAFQCLTIFIDRLYSFHIPSIYGVVDFNSKITYRCPMTAFGDHFLDKLFEIQPNSKPKLWDSFVMSCNEIFKYRKDTSGKEIFKNAVSRILLISNGEDIDSSAKVEEVVKNLVKNKIVVDSIIFCNEENKKFKTICAVSHITGGLSFKFKENSDFLSLFENVSFVDYNQRHVKSVPLIPGDLSTIPSRIKTEQITKEFIEKVSENATFDLQVQSEVQFQFSQNVQLATPLNVCAINEHIFIPNNRNRRILKELHMAAEISDRDCSSYNPDIKIFPFKSRIDKWIVFIKGDENTAYSNKWLKLYVSFPDLYPNEPPEIGFITVPYHANISRDGRICMYLIDKGYLPSMQVVHIIQEIRSILLLEDKYYFVNLDMIDQFIFNKDEYDKKVKEISDKNFPNDYKHYLNSSDKIVDDVPDGFSLDLSEDIPLYMISQITGKVFPKNRMYMASSGIYYDKDEFLQYVCCKKDPICIVTGTSLYERAEDLLDEEIDDIL